MADSVIVCKCLFRTPRAIPRKGYFQLNGSQSYPRPFLANIQPRPMPSAPVHLPFRLLANPSAASVLVDMPRAYRVNLKSCSRRLFVHALPFPTKTPAPSLLVVNTPTQNPPALTGCAASHPLEVLSLVSESFLLISLLVDCRAGLWVGDSVMRRCLPAAGSLLAGICERRLNSS